MRNNRHVPLLALATAGVLWGTTVPLTKVALAGLGPGWLAVARFALAALPLAWFARRRLRAAWSPAAAGWGVFGYGAMLVLQNAGVARTSVAHAALIIGVTPGLVAVLSVALRRDSVRQVVWLGCAVTLAGVATISMGGGGGATAAGDALVLASVLISALFMIAQPGILAGRDPVAVTAVQLAAAAAGMAPAALLADGIPTVSPGPVPLLALAGLAIGGTLVPYTLLAYGQSRVPPTAASVFFNLEPLVGAVIGVLAFGNLLSTSQIVGDAAILAGIVLAALPCSRREGAHTIFPGLPGK